MAGEDITPTGPEAEMTSGDLEPAEQTADKPLELEPVRDQGLRWNVSWGEVLSANPEKQKLLMANMNEQIKRLYELWTQEMELGRPLTPQEIDLTLHREKAEQELPEESEAEPEE